jgi:primosomal protein N' (replication factor Y)
VEKVGFHFDLPFLYVVPKNLETKINVGSRVFVPFGKGNAKRSAFVLEFANNCEEKKLKEVIDLADKIVLPLRFLKLAKWMSERYFCSIYEASVACLSCGKTVGTDVFSNLLDLKISCNNNKEKTIFSPAQACTYDKLANWFKDETKKPALLYGVTGSGKTKVYLEIASMALERGENVLFMVPEISLISQASVVFEKRFGKEKIAFFHSGLKPKSRREEWYKVKIGVAKIAIGTRSAVFAPFEKIGLTIIDEEQEPTYKSDSKPRFHAREAANFLCRHDNGKLLLVSATPSVEVFYSAMKGSIFLVKLTQRYGNASFSKPEIIDMRKTHMLSEMLSLRLIEILSENLNNKKKSIFLLDRRGFHTLVRCAFCGNVLICPNCNITLSAHYKKILLENSQIVQNSGKLLCHCCGYSEIIPKICPSCGKNKIRFTGTGTQKLEDEIKKFIPSARCLRVDADTTVSKESYKKMFEDFRNNKYDIMLGTRMVAKGLDFENVNLIGILCADHALYGQYHKSYERAFSLIAQVTGRSGRGESHLKCASLIQTFSPYNNIIELASKQDYDNFFKNEIILRKKLLYPPFSDICLIGFTGTNEQKTEISCKFFCEILKFEAKNSFSELPLRILSPTPAIIKKAFNKFRYKIILKCKNNKIFREFILKSMKTYEKTRKIENFEIASGIKNSVSIFIDINPESLF